MWINMIYNKKYERIPMIFMTYIDHKEKSILFIYFVYL